MTLNQNQTFKTNELCAYTSIGNKSIILNIENGQYYELNSTSTLIWKLINEGNTIADLISTILMNIILEMKLLVNLSKNL